MGGSEGREEAPEVRRKTHVRAAAGAGEVAQPTGRREAGPLVHHVQVAEAVHQVPASPRRCRRPRLVAFAAAGIRTAVRVRVSGGSGWGRLAGGWRPAARDSWRFAGGKGFGAASFVTVAAAAAAASAVIAPQLSFLPLLHASLVCSGPTLPRCGRW
jgi:hypothetical protein